MHTDRTTYALDGLAALDSTSVTVTSSALGVGGGGDRKKGHGEGGEGGEVCEHVDIVEDAKRTEAIDELG